jgi:UDP-glucose 4-epimerase
VGGILDLIRLPEAAGKVFNFGNDEPVCLRVLAKKLRSQIDPRLEIFQVPYLEVFVPGFEEIRRRVPDLTRIKTR